MKPDLKTAVTLAELRLVVGRWRKAGKTISLVPTMGALHDGHLSLVKLARKQADKVITSIFVNPKQFGAGEDLQTYPRDEAGDLAKLASGDTHLVYLPSVEQIYPKGFATNISVKDLSNRLCGAVRPDHFDGVATVVAKLLLHARPDLAVFGEKDYQQLSVIKRLVTDLDLGVKIVGAPIVREIDGLALSSRNAYLSKKQRKSAPLIYRVLIDTAEALKNGTKMKKAAHDSRGELQQHGFELDYFALCNAQTLEPMVQLSNKPARLLIAARLGRTRLIDNLAVMG